MKLKNIKEVEQFRKVVHECEGDVYLKSQEGDVFNLKSALSEYIALGQLLGEQGDNLELFADKHEDEARLIRFLTELDKENGKAFQPEQCRSFSKRWRSQQRLMRGRITSSWSVSVQIRSISHASMLLVSPSGRAVTEGD